MSDKEQKEEKKIIINRDGHVKAANSRMDEAFANREVPASTPKKVSSIEAWPDPPAKKDKK
jgi:hypothetical protein